MSDYARVRVAVEYSLNSDYSRPLIDKSYTKELTPDEGYWRRLEVSNGAATTLVISEFATVTSLVIYNSHATDYVTVGYTSSGAATACSFQVAAGDWAKIVDVDPSVDPTFQSGAGAVTMELIVTGT